MKKLEQIIFSSLLLILSFSVRGEVLVIVNQQNTVEKLNKSQVIDLFMGRFIAFPNGDTALPIDHPTKSESRADFYKKLTGKTVSQINAYWARLVFTGRATPPKVLPDSKSVIELVKQNKNAIAYIDKLDTMPGVKVILSFN